MKKQFWMRPDQVELTIECLKFSKMKIADRSIQGDAHEMAGRFVFKRINELLEIEIETWRLIEQSEKE